jgi:hypothetical protein
MDNKIDKFYYECKRCFYKSYQKSDIKKHLDKKKICDRKLESYKYKDEELTNLSLERNYVVEKKDFLCKNCNKIFFNTSNLKRHLEKYCKKNNEKCEGNVNIDNGKDIDNEKNDNDKNNDNNKDTNITAKSIINNEGEIPNILSCNNVVNINEKNITLLYENDWETTSRLKLYKVL